MQIAHARAPGRAILAAMFAVSLFGAQAESASPNPPTDAPVEFYNHSIDGATSTVAGITKYLLTGDVDGDGREDVFHFTSRGLQVFRNAGLLPSGVPDFQLTQELPLTWSCGGTALDWDGDGDVDIVTSDTQWVVVLRNTGGTFTVDRLVEHGFRVPSLAKATRTVPVVGRPAIRNIIVAPVQGFLGGDFLGPNPGLLPYPYVLHDTGTGFVVTGRGHPSETDSIDCLELSPGVQLVLVADRSPTAPHPVHAYRLAEGTGALTDLDPTLWNPGVVDLTGLFFDFGYSVSAGSLGNGEILFGWGSWHRSSLYRIENLGPLVADVEDVPLDPGFVEGFSIGEVFAFELADVDCDGDFESIQLGRDSGIQVSDITPTGVSAPCFGPNIPGVTTDMVLADFDLDTNAAPDYVVGGHQGLFYLRNTKGGAATGAPPNELILDAIYCLQSILDPARVPPLVNVRARLGLTGALSALLNIDPIYITTEIFAAGPPRFPRLVGVYTIVRSALAAVGLAKARLSPRELAAFGPKLDDTRDRLLDALDQIVDELLVLSGGTFPPKRGDKAIRRSNKLRDKAQKLLERARDLRVKAEATENLRKQGRIYERAARFYKRAMLSAARAGAELAEAGYLND